MLIGVKGRIRLKLIGVLASILIRVIYVTVNYM